jgi:hypothetical protein
VVCIVDDSWSYKKYKDIVLKNKSQTVSFKEAMLLKSFVLIRHDVEFSPKSAYNMAKIDRDLKVHSVFLFQVSATSYNLASKENIDIVQKIYNMGLDVGLHVNLFDKNKKDAGYIFEEVEKQKQIFESITEINPSVFSMHRPRDAFLSIRQDIICEMINAYGPSFFEYSKNPLNIKYMSDSRHKFEHGDPMNNYEHKKIQILLHPEEWSVVGGGGRDSVVANIVSEKSKLLINNIFEEYELKI